MNRWRLALGLGVTLALAGAGHVLAQGAAGDGTAPAAPPPAEGGAPAAPPAAAPPPPAAPAPAERPTLAAPRLLPAPAKVWLEDAPNDDGRRLAVRWDHPKATAPEVQLQVQISTRAEGPFLDAADPVSLETAWIKDLAGEYGFFTPSDESAGHVVIVSPLSVKTFSPEALVRLVLAGDPEKTKAGAQALLLLGSDIFVKVKAILDEWKVSSLSGFLGHVRTGVLVDASELVVARPWFARVVVRPVDGGPEREEVAAAASLEPSSNWFDWRKVNNFGFMVLLCGLVLGFIQKARKNPNLYLRRIPGLDAVEEALGRATEMGKPVLFVHGLTGMDSVSTIASVNILGEVAKKVARYDSQLLCANVDPIVLAVSQETVREGYTHAGRPDAYSEDQVFLAASEQFAYVAAVNGIMVRKKPAANLYCGYFYAESLLLAETGAQTGAIQIAATDSFTQLPFFVTTCDYTLMGEELYAASAYLSRDPSLLGSLKGQDWGKALIIGLLVVGAALSVAGFPWVAKLVQVF